MQELKALELKYKTEFRNKLKWYKYDQTNPLLKCIIDDFDSVMLDICLELEQYEQNFKDKEFKYRTQCQNVVSAARLEADDMPDRLAELEKLVLDYCLDKGYEIGKGEWYFEIVIDTFYQWKLLVVKFTDKNKHPKPELFYQNMSVTTKEMWDKAIKHFSLKAEPLQKDIKLELDDTNQSAIYKIAGYESDGRE